MSYYDDNMKCLEKYKKNIYDVLADTNEDVSDSMGDILFTETAINGEPILMLQRGNEVFRMNSTYHPSHEAQIWADQFKLNNLNNVTLMFGLGSGIFARELYSRMGKQDLLFIYEPSRQIFSYVLRQFYFSDLLSCPNIVFAIEGANDFEFHNLLQSASSITNFSTQIKCAHPYYESLFGESCIKFLKEIKDTIIHTRINVNTTILFGQRTIINGFKNIKYLKDCNILEDFAADIDRELPAIVVAAGPSLRHNIEELKRAKGKSYIFIVDRILDYVLDNGLIPDFVVTIDPMKPIEYFTTREDVTVPLLCEQVSNWEILDTHKGKKIFYSCNEYFKEMFQLAGKNPPSLTTGASVATAAFSICIKLGFHKIVLVGQDLAYDGDMTHAGGVAEKFDDQDLMVEGIDGKQVRSRYDWHEFLVWFQDAIQLNPNIQVIDTKQKGAKIKGAELISLKEVVDRYCIRETGFDQILKKKKSTFDSEDIKKVKIFYENSLKELDYLKRKSKEAIGFCDSQLAEYRKEKQNNSLLSMNHNKLLKINEKLHRKKSYYILDSYITALAASDIAKLYYFTEDAKTDQIKTYEKSKIIYDAIIEGVNFSASILKKEIKQLD